LDEPVSKGGFAVVNMRHDREIADFGQFGHGVDMIWNLALVKRAYRVRGRLFDLKAFWFGGF
jgi:hypothetical protein